MKVKNPTPNEKISDYVRNILVIENFQVINPFVLPLYANGSPTLLFQTAKGRIKENSNNLSLFGQTVFPETLIIDEGFTLIAYFFKPFAISALFSFSAQELTDNPIDICLLEPSRTFELQERLLNSDTIKEMINLIDNYILSLIKKEKADIDLIKFATTEIAKTPDNKILKKVQNELHLTERTFQRMFKENIGVSPNQFRRISQFSSAFKQLQQKEFENLFDIAFDNGYSDQSHFARSFKEFTNITPKEYLKFDNL